MVRLAASGFGVPHHVLPYAFLFVRACFGSVPPQAKDSWDLLGGDFSP